MSVFMAIKPLNPKITSMKATAEENAFVKGVR